MTKCTKCGSQLTFVKIDGKYHPKNLDGTDHHDVCREITNKAIIERNVKFKDSSGEGFLKQNNERLYMSMRAKPIKGKFYKESSCDCIPWEDCKKCA